jgi:hypothetical protein
MKFIDTYQSFREIEDRYNLFDREIANLRFWDYLRFPLWIKIVVSSGLIDDPSQDKKSSSSFTERLCLVGRYLRNAFFLNPLRYKKCDYLFIGAGPMRKKRMEDKSYFDLWCDPIIDHLGRDCCILLEEPFWGRHRAINHVQKLASTSWVQLCVALGNCFKRRSTAGLSEVELQFLEELDVTIANTFKIPSIKITETVCDLLHRHRIQQTCLSKLFDTLNPKAIFIMCSYGGREKYIEVAQSLGIPTIELQHGTVSPYHIGYSYPKGTSKKLAPDFFLSFGKYWEDTVELAIPSGQVETMGYPHLDDELSTYKGRSKKTQIVFLSQRTIGKKLSEFAVKLDQQLPPDWKIMYKLHPKEISGWEDRYSVLADSTVHVIAGDSPSLYDLLGDSAIQVGVYSTALYEGMALGCQTYLVNLEGVENMQSLIEKDICKLVNHPNEINLTYDYNTKIFDKDYFFAENWKKNLDKALGNWIESFNQKNY